MIVVYPYPYKPVVEAGRMIEHGGLKAEIVEKGHYIPGVYTTQNMESEITVFHRERGIAKISLRIRERDDYIDPLTPLLSKRGALTYTMWIYMDAPVEAVAIRDLLLEAGYIFIAVSISPGRKVLRASKTIEPGLVETNPVDRISWEQLLSGEITLSKDGEEDRFEIVLSIHGYNILATLKADQENGGREPLEIGRFMEELSSGIYVSAVDSIEDDLKLSW